MEESEIKFNEFLSKIDDFIDKNQISVPFYRGCSNTSYKLLPSLFRNQEIIKRNLLVTQLENNLFYDFSAYGDGIIDDKNDWNILFKMQHYGIPTRLLDWSESLGVAIYFAIESSKVLETPCIWILDPYLLNGQEENIEKYTNLEYSTLYNPNRDFKISYYDAFITGYLNNKPNLFEYPRALYPIKSNNRIRAQWGVFTIHGNKEGCISEMVTNDIVRKFEIPKEAIPAAKKFLRRASLNHFSMFPDMDGLKNQLNTDYYNF